MKMVYDFSKYIYLYIGQNYFEIFCEIDINRVRESFHMSFAHSILFDVYNILSDCMWCVRAPGKLKSNWVSIWMAYTNIYVIE